MDLNKLRYFYIVATHEHMTKAAEEIRIAQPALTKAIHTLEDELGVPLFEKSGRNIRLTVFGRHLKARLDGVFPVLDRIPAELTVLKQEKMNTVRLNVLAASTMVTGAVISYKKEHPHTIFELTQSEEETDCDISVITDNCTVKQSLPIKEEYRMDERIDLAVPTGSPLSSLSSIALEQVRDEEFIILAGSRPFREICDSFCARAGFKPRISFESDSLIAVQNSIGAGAGIGFWPEHSWCGAPTGDTRLLTISEPPCKRTLVFRLHETARRSDAAERFFAHLVSRLCAIQNEKP